MNSVQDKPVKSHPEQIEELIRHLDVQLASIEYPDGGRVRLSMATFGVALEHIFAIAQLFRMDMYASAFVLLRPTLEATIKGAWIHLCATEKDLFKYGEGKELSSVKDLLMDLKPMLPKIVFDSLNDTLELRYKHYSSFNHAGYHQIYERIVQGQEPKYSFEEIEDVTNTVLILGLIIGIEHARMGGDQKLITELSALLPE